MSGAALVPSPASLREAPSPSRGEGQAVHVAPTVARNAVLPSPLEGEGGAPAPGEGPKKRRPRTTTRRQLGFARAMRVHPTESERQLWSLLRDRRLSGHKFRRQVPIGPYIVDFFCPSAKLVVELDGSQHADDPGDIARDAWLRGAGYRVMRVWNNELTHNRSGVLEGVWHALNQGEQVR